MNTSSFKHSSRNRPLKLSTNPAPTGAAGQEILDAAISWASEDADRPDPASPEWQAVITIIQHAPGKVQLLRLHQHDGIGRRGRNRMPDNQTHDEWLTAPSVAGDTNAKGTGVVFRTDDGVKEYIKNVEYEKFLEQAAAENFDSYSWVPHAIATEQQILAAADSCKNYRCAGKCPPSCICNRKTGRCK